MEQVELSEAIFAAVALFNLPSQEVSDQLLPVANSQHCRANAQQPGIDGGAASIVDARWAARDDNALPSCKFGGWSFTRSYFRVDAEIADFSGDQVAVLSTSVEDRYLRLQSLAYWLLARWLCAFTR